MRHISEGVVMKKLCLLGLLTVLFMPFVLAENIYIQVNRDDERYKSDPRYEYIYMNPPKKSIVSNGRYIMISSGVRYVHSPSKRKRAAHAARINAYNYEYGNY